MGSTFSPACCGTEGRAQTSELKMPKQKQRVRDSSGMRGMQ